MCNIKRDISYAILFSSFFLYITGAILGVGQAGVGSNTDMCAGLPENICQGEGQPCSSGKVSIVVKKLVPMMKMNLCVNLNQVHVLLIKIGLMW